MHWCYSTSHEVTCWRTVLLVHFTSTNCANVATAVGHRNAATASTDKLLKVLFQIFLSALVTATIERKLKTKVLIFLIWCLNCSADVTTSRASGITISDTVDGIEWFASKFQPYLLAYIVKQPHLTAMTHAANWEHLGILCIRAYCSAHFY